MLRNTDIEQTLPHLPTLLACHSQNAQDAFDYTSRVAIPNSISELRYLASLNLFSANIGVGYSTDRRAKTMEDLVYGQLKPAWPRAQPLPAPLFTLRTCSQGSSSSLPPSSHSVHARRASVPPYLPLHTQNMLAVLQFLPASLFTLRTCSQGSSSSLPPSSHSVHARRAPSRLPSSHSHHCTVLSCQTTGSADPSRNPSGALLAGGISGACRCGAVASVSLL